MHRTESVVTDITQSRCHRSRLYRLVYLSRRRVASRRRRRVAASAGSGAKTLEPLPSRRRSADEQFWTRIRGLGTNRRPPLVPARSFYIPRCLQRNSYSEEGSDTADHCVTTCFHSANKGESVSNTPLASPHGCDTGCLCAVLCACLRFSSLIPPLPLRALLLYAPLYAMRAVSYRNRRHPPPPLLSPFPLLLPPVAYERVVCRRSFSQKRAFPPRPAAWGPSIAAVPLSRTTAHFRKRRGNDRTSSAAARQFETATLESLRSRVKEATEERVVAPIVRGSFTG